MSNTPSTDPPIALLVSDEGLSLIQVPPMKDGIWPPIVKVNDLPAVRRGGTEQPLMYEKVRQ